MQKPTLGLQRAKGHLQALGSAHAARVDEGGDKRDPGHPGHITMNGAARKLLRISACRTKRISIENASAKEQQKNLARHR
jgi:hypothetical protein